VHKHNIAPGDLILLCSDGLTEMLPDDEIAALLSAPDQSPDQLTQTLVEQANAAGGTDNITVVIARFDATATAVL